MHAVLPWSSEGEPIAKPKRKPKPKAEGWHTSFENGCHHHPDCFTCPYQDCLLGTGGLSPTASAAW